MVHFENNFLKPSKDLRNLQLLEEISEDSAVSQRKLASRLGLALGVTNACIKKMITKGYVKTKGINHKRIAYYVTPKGFTEKARLTYHFLQHTIDYYRKLKINLVSKLKEISAAGHKEILFYGAGEVMEVAFICLGNTGLKLIGIADDSVEKQGKKIFGFLIQTQDEIEALKPDCVFITSIRYKDEIFQKLKEKQGLTNTAFYML
ncbi:winged helix-turn-helix transcriptional regulator [Candidatus Omnitrophota bacterium]